MASDWPEWASRCAERRTAPAAAVVPASLGLTVSGPAGTVWVGRVDVATGDVREGAAVLAFRRRR